jgi:EAL domain-containing protein (putative c-di-GMP-specific phosphodiesterase class I)
VGDAVISEVASILQHQMPRTALAARLAGDRYAVLVPGADVTGALALAQTVARAITEITGTSADGAVRVSVSIGVAAVEPSSPQPLAHALAAAEQASKRSKRAQRPAGDKVGAASSASSEACVDEVSVADLRAWLEADRFELHAQPILALSDATTEPRFEILLRGLSADGVPLTPGKLIAAAEGHGLMPAIDSWVIEKAFAMLGLQRQVLTTRSARFSINLSRQSLADDTVPALIEQAWRRSGVPADLVCFEIAEAAVLAAPERAVRTLHRLRRLGFQTALDDAGSARLTTNQVTALPLDVIKLDGALVRRAIVDADAAGVLAEMITHAGGLRRITVANGVETDDQRRLLSGMGADYGQGFVIGRPGVLVSVLRDVAMYAQIDAGTRAKVREQ